MILAAGAVFAGGSSEPADPNAIGGTITMLTNRTDVVDTDFVEYAKRFQERYPDVTVEFEAMTDYEGELRTRMNTEDYGDVLMISSDLPVDQLPDFHEPLGTYEELQDDYLIVNEQMYDGLVYGIPVGITVQGIVFNQPVFDAAGITDFPTTPDGFVEIMEQIESNTDATPYYTNYAAGWPLNWNGHVIGISGDPDYPNKVMAEIDEPWAEGEPHFVLARLLWDLVSTGVIENDPTTTDWEDSKRIMGNNEIGAMILGSWAISQMQEFADSPDDIGYMPFPYTVNGQIYSEMAGDYNIGINVHSDNKATARAWVDFFVNESGFAKDQGMIPPVQGASFPDTLVQFENLGVEFLQANPAPEGMEGLVNRIDGRAEIGLNDGAFRQRIVEAALGRRDESFQDIMDDLNARWTQARDELGL